MKITYIHHSSFLAEWDHGVFLFDYFEGEIPQTDPEKPVFVFASHRHPDHFSERIFELFQGNRQVTYVLSDDIWRRRVPEELLGRTVFLGPGETAVLEDGAGEPIEIEALRSTDEGVAFLVTVQGKTLFHAGDLNRWVWEGEPEEDNARMTERFCREMKKLAGRPIDIAFMLLDPRQEKDFYLGMDDFMRMAGADVVFPMHFWGDFQVISRFKELECSKAYRERIIEIGYKGQEWDVL